jgi:3-oxoacyl-[acyl-carrier-protein] synthase-3
MQTDSEQLMREGVATGVAAFERFLDDAGWTREQIDHSFCHQVGSAHRKLMLESLRLDPARDFATLEYLGNTGSAALPTTMAIGIEQGQVKNGNRIAMLGIGSGINCTMLAVEWAK